MNKVIYIYGNCSNQKYRKLFTDSKVMISQQAQKYHSLLIEGLVANNVRVSCLSGLPVNRELTKKIYIKKETEIWNTVRYHYFATVNIGLIRRIQLMLKSLFTVLFSSKIDTIIICDVLNVSVALGSLLGAKIKKQPIVGIVTDVPGYLAHSGKISMTEKINASFLNCFSAYVFLTEEMDNVVNSKKKPYIIMEGHVDWNMTDIRNNIKNKKYPKIIMYAGTLKRIYGIEQLAKAFIKANVADWELHIYGDGDFREELIGICSNNPNIQYCGIKLNDEIVEAEIQASLLVNPRPTEEDYTKYSFPSKNMEYMVSGTPVLTTKLPGMPKEYYSYVYLIEDETIEGLKKTLIAILNKSNEELYEFGKKAKKFVLEEKNNIIQAKKIIDMIDMNEEKSD